MTLRPPFFLILLAVFVSARAVALPLEDGEHLTYRVSWAIVPGAGEIKIDAQKSAANPNQLLVTSSTATRRLAKLLLPFEARSTSTFDLTSGRLVALHEKAMTRAKPSEHTVSFDYAKREAVYTKIVPREAPRTLPFPDGDPVDLIMALLQTRTWNLKPGDKRDALVLFDDDFYELTLHALRFEQLRTSLGTFNTLVLEPRMDKTPPKGMFKRGSTVRVWIAQDDHKLPVQFQVEFKIGTGTATLEKYRPPANSPTAAPVPPSGRASSDAKDSRP